MRIFRTLYAWLKAYFEACCNPEQHSPKKIKADALMDYVNEVGRNRKNGGS